jgi:hypothetical protein
LVSRRTRNRVIATIVFAVLVLVISASNVFSNVCPCGA